MQPFSADSIWPAAEVQAQTSTDRNRCRGAFQAVRRERTTDRQDAMSTPSACAMSLCTSSLNDVRTWLGPCPVDLGKLAVLAMI